MARERSPGRAIRARGRYGAPRAGVSRSPLAGEQGQQVQRGGQATIAPLGLEGTLTFLNPASGYAIQVSGPGFETFTIP